MTRAGALTLHHRRELRIEQGPVDARLDARAAGRHVATAPCGARRRGGLLCPGRRRVDLASTTLGGNRCSLADGQGKSDGAGHKKTGNPAIKGASCTATPRQA